MKGEIDDHPWTIADAFEVFNRLRPQRVEKMILVGGQAAAFWITEYNNSISPELLTTKDIDVFVNDDGRLALECARDLEGRLEVFSGARSPDVARVRFPFHGSELNIDFLRSVHGVSTGNLLSSKLKVTGRLSKGRHLYVMHPVYSLASRLFNTFSLPGRLTGENLARLRHSIEAARLYLSEMLTDRATEVRDSIEQLREMALSREGLIAWTGYRIDLFVAAPEISELTKCGPQFVEKRFPQMLESVRRKREGKRHASTRQKATRRTRP